MTARSYAEVIGDPIEQSKSPLIHGFWLEALGIEADYERRRVGRAELPDFLEQRRADLDWRGCNVTMPLKLDALSLADEASDQALGAGAANVLLVRDGRLLAGNTDVTAVLRLVERLATAGAGTGLVTLLGSGGAARAALMAFRQLGLYGVRIHSRNMAEAYSLAVQFALSEEPRSFDAPIGGDGLINATPLGMDGAPPFELELDGLAADGWVLDFVTVPVETELMRWARGRGMTVIDGIGLLVEQAAESFRLFFGAEPPRERDTELMARLRA